MDKKQVLISIGLLATVGVTGLAFQYRREIIGLFSGKKIIKTKAVSLAKKELAHWNNGEIKEGNAQTLEQLDNYWKSVGYTYSKMKNEAWSAAFISYLMKESGAKSTFDYSPSHSTYIRSSIKNKAENKGSWKGYKPSEVRVQVGDLVCFARQSGVKYESTGSYASHCDLVSKVDKRAGMVYAIGGNVSDSIKESKFKIDKEGKLSEGKHFVVIKNK